jgi:hypothetical protein
MCNPTAEVRARREPFLTPPQDVLDHTDAVALHVRIFARAGLT